MNRLLAILIGSVTALAVIVTTVVVTNFPTGAPAGTTPPSQGEASSASSPALPDIDEDDEVEDAARPASDDDSRRSAPRPATTPTVVTVDEVAQTFTVEAGDLALDVDASDGVLVTGLAVDGTEVLDTAIPSAATRIRPFGQAVEEGPPGGFDRGRVLAVFGVQPLHEGGVAAEQEGGLAQDLVDATRIVGHVFIPGARRRQASRRRVYYIVA